MAFTSYSTTGHSQTNKVAGTSIGFGLNEDVPAGKLLIFVVGCDNLGATTDGDKGDITSVTDNAGNTYTKAREFSNVQTGAGTGATVSIWYSILTTTITAATGVVTVNFNGSVTAKVYLAHAFTIGSGSTIGIYSSVLANDALDAGSMSLSALPSREYLFVRACAIEAAAATGTVSTNYTVFAPSYGTSGTTGGSASTNIWLQAEYRILTGTSDSTDPTTGAADIASAMVAFYEISGIPNKKYQPNRSALTRAYRY